MLIKELRNNLITDVDVKHRIVKGYFSIFGNVDADNDMIMPGAYSKTIKENKRIKHLYQHDVTQPLSSVRGGTLKLWEDSKGLAFESEISNTSWGRDVITLYDDGVINEHSVGIVVLKKNKKSGYREITEVKMFEGSTVTWGANEQAFGDIVKNINTSKLVKSLKTNNFESVEIIDLLDLYIKQLKNVITPSDDTDNEEPKTNTLLKSFEDAKTEFLNKLKH